MENLVKQMRVRFSGVEQDGQQDPQNTREQRISQQKFSSFKEDGKQQNWFQRQISPQISRDYDSSDDGQHATAVAAAAFAINSLQEAKLADEKKIREGVAGQPYTGRISRKSTSKERKEDKKSPERMDQRIPKNVVASEKKPEKAPSRVPSTGRTPTFAEQMDTRPKPIPPPIARPTLSAAGDDKWNNSSTRTRGPQSKADTWMEVEMAKIKKRYEKMNSTIQAWEEEKKKKARRRLDRKEGELEKRRARVLQQHRIEIQRINQIVQGAKAQAEEKRRNEQLKAKERANKIRATGKVPATCFFF